MEIRFQGVDRSEASVLARELELSLKYEGVPGGALKVLPISPEAMGLEVLGVDLEIVLHALGGVGYIAVFGKCIYELLGKHKFNIVLKTKHGVELEIPSGDVDIEKIKKILSNIDEIGPKA
jgi:hypothetical protein